MAGIEPSGVEVAVTVRDNRERSRYEVYAADDLAGFTQYELGSDQISFMHTETEPPFTGRGFAGHLVTAALDDVRQRGLAVLPFCSYVRNFIAKHPEYLDLVPAVRRAEFNL